MPIRYAVNDNYSTSQGATLNIAAPGVLSNDTDADLDPLTAIKVTDPSHGTLTLNSDGSFSYVNDDSASTTDAFTYRASDGTNESEIATVTINITLNAPPSLGSIEGSTLNYTEGDGPVSVTSSITVSDDDDTDLTSAVITISSNYQNGEDVLSFTNTGGITGSWNAGAGQLTLSGTASVAGYQAALRAVRYTNSSANPNNSTRTVTFRVYDGTDNSNTVSRTISVTGTNIAPVLGGIEGSALAYTEGDGPVSITSTHHRIRWRQYQPGFCSNQHFLQLPERRGCTVFHECQRHNRFMECRSRTTDPYRKRLRFQLPGCPACSEIYQQQR